MKYFECVNIPKQHRDNPSSWLNTNLIEGKIFQGFVEDASGRNTKVLFLVDNDVPDLVVDVNRNMAAFIAIEFHHHCVKNDIHNTQAEFASWWLDYGRLVVKLKEK